MAVFDVNFPNLVNQLLPVRLRRAKMLAWLNILTGPVVYLYNLFTNNRNANLYNLAHNGQVVKLNAALNDAFDNTARRIYISDPVYNDPVYLYQDDEEKPVYIYQDAENKPVWLYQDTEVYAVDGVDFVVNVPMAVLFDMGRMKSLINLYRLPSKNKYTIVTF